MQPNAGKLRRLDVPVKRLREPVRIERRSVLLAENEVKGGVVGAERGCFVALRGPVLT
ncbi:hypothetical protein BH18ACT12_BH18ACT12_00740 [soil metagenome]